MRRLLTNRWVLIGLGLLAAMEVAVVLMNRPSTAPPGPLPAAAGSYADLTPEQRRLVDDWVARLADAAGKPMDARALYDGLGLSTRTTFTAVTQALSRTPSPTPPGSP